MSGYGDTETVEQRVGHLQVVRIHDHQLMLDTLVIRFEGDGGEYSDDLVILQGSTWVMDDYDVRLKESLISERRVGRLHPEEKRPGVHDGHHQNIEG